MSDAVLTLLKIGLLAGLYAFFAWVLWSAFNQLRASPAASAPAATPQPRFATASKAPKATQGQVVIREPAELAGAVISIGDELSIGRAAACTLTLDDTFVSQKHASIIWQDRQYLATDTGSTNGTFVNGERLTSPVVLRPGDRVQIGSTVLEFS